MQPNVAGKPRVFGPDLIRAAAISLVVWSHTFPGGTEFPLFGAARYLLGALGVEIFFLLSGFLIGGILMEDLLAGRLEATGGTVSFWKRRWFRTLPNYFVFLCLNLLLFRCVQGHFPAAAGSFFWFGQALFWPDPDFFMSAWSLALEEWFYLLFPVALFAFSKLLRQRKQALLSAIILFLVAPLIARCLMSPSTVWDPGIRRVTLPRLDAIGYGVLLAFIRNYHGQTWRWLVKLWPLGAIATLGIIVHFCHRSFTLGYPSAGLIFYRAFYFSLVSLSLALLFPKAAELGQPANWTGPAIRKLSLWSYSMYLSHIVILGLVDLVFKRMGISYHLAHVLRFFLVWSLTIPASAMIYTYFEKPMMNLRDRPWKEIFRRSPPPVPASIPS